MRPSLFLVPVLVVTSAFAGQDLEQVKVCSVDRYPNSVLPSVERLADALAEEHR